MNNFNKKQDNIDAFIENDSIRFRLRACCVIINENKVLMMKNNTEDYYYSVGGAIKIGETIEEACLREVVEETGYSFEIDRLLFIHENLFTHNNKSCHEIAFYFLMKSNDNINLLCNTKDSNENAYWIDISKYSEYKAYPTFFSTELQELPKEVKTITTKR